LGRTFVPVYKGRIDLHEQYPDLFNAVAPMVWSAWVHDYLGWDERDNFNFIPPTATVAVCTHDRPDDLKRCLDALVALPDDGQEILIIDNCPSTDETRVLVAQYPGVRYVREDRVGLDIARNRALLEARNEVVAFTDDDATPDNNWLRSILKNFNSPMVMCVTGLTMPFELETKAQQVFEKHNSFSKGFKRVVHSNLSRNPLAPGGVGAGANMAVRKSLLQEVGPFDEALDAGTKTHSGGDHEMFVRILTAGYQIVYDPAALSWHRHRRTWEELQKTVYGYGVGVYALWTRTLLVHREWGVFRMAFSWFWNDQLRHFVKSLIKRRDYIPMDLILAEFRGCLAGPGAYLASRKKLRSKK
jgi:GT2 family glycosyltransferase